MAETEESIKSLDNAIQSCDAVIKSHQRSILFLISIILASVSVLGLFLVWPTLFQKKNYEELAVSYKALRTENDSLRKHLPANAKMSLLDLSSTIGSRSNESKSDFGDYAIYLIVVIVISISTGLYRLHLKEISKAEQHRIAFYRIRIAGNNYTEGYGTEVRNALTDSPFTNYQDSPIFSKTTKIESPVPGHPASDVVTTLINKLIEVIETKKK